MVLKQDQRTAVTARVEVMRRFLVLTSLALAWGGFTFYAAVVVPVATAVVGGTTQGFVTRHVTHALNAAAALSLLLLAWEYWATAGRRSRRIRRLFGGCLVGLALTLAGLLWLHVPLDRMLDAREFSVADPDRFYQLHRYYLWISSAQWLLQLVVWGLLTRPAPGGEPRST